MADELIEWLQREIDAIEMLDQPGDANLLRDARDFIEQHTRIEPEAADRGVSEALVEALTPSGETKAAYMGEFEFDYRSYYGNETVQVPWTTIKEIMAAIRDRAAIQSLRSEQEGGQ